MSQRFVCFGVAATTALALTLVTGCGSSPADDTDQDVTKSALYGLPANAVQAFLCTAKTHFAEGAGSGPRGIPASFQFKAVRYVRQVSSGARKVYGIGIGELNTDGVFQKIGGDAWGLSLPPKFLEDYNAFTLIPPNKDTVRVIELTQKDTGGTTLPAVAGHFDFSYEGNGYVFSKDELSEDASDVLSENEWILVKEQATFQTAGSQVQFQGHFYANVINRERAAVRQYGGVVTFSGNCTPQS